MAPPTHDELLSLQTLGSPVLSPQGDLVVYTVTSTDWDRDSFVSQLWIAATDGSVAPRQLTNDKNGASGPQWSPDGAYVTFVAKRGDDKPQVHALPLQGGEAICLTAADRGVVGHAWSSDGSTIAFLALEPETEAWKERKETFGDFVLFRSPTDQEHTHIWTIEVAAALAGEAQPGVQRTSGKEFTCSAGFMGTPLRWAPGSSTKLAFVGTDNPDLTAGNTATIYILDLSAAGVGTVTPLIKQPGADGNPHWSPCGEYIAYTSQIGRTTNALNSILCVLPAVGTASGAKPLELSHGFDENPSPLAWTTSGIYFSGSEKTASHLFLCGLIDPAADSATSLAPITRVTGPDNAMLSGFTLSKDGSVCACLAASSTALPELMVGSTDAWSPTPLTDMTAQIKGWDPLGQREVISWDSKDGQSIEGILITPAGFDKSDTATKRALLCVIHGGPTGIDTPSLPDRNYYPIEQWVAEGAIVLKVNYRGSAGYGEAFSEDAHSLCGCLYACRCLTMHECSYIVLPWFLHYLHIVSKGR